MRQKQIMALLAMMAVTGVVSVPNSLAVAWQVDISDRHGRHRSTGLAKAIDPVTVWSTSPAQPVKK